MAGASMCAGTEGAAGAEPRHLLSIQRKVHSAEQTLG